MDDSEVDAYISKRIQDLDLTLPDFINGRMNMPRILTKGEYCQFNPYCNLAVPLKDIFRYSWNNIADHDAMIDTVLCDIETEYKDRMLPRKELQESTDTSGVIQGILAAVG